MDAVTVIVMAHLVCVGNLATDKRECETRASCFVTDSAGKLSSAPLSFCGLKQKEDESGEDNDELMPKEKPGEPK